MVLQDCADELLGILFANPDKIDRQLLTKLKLKADLFSVDKAQEYLFRLICLAAYANKQVNEAFIDAYCSKNKISKELSDDIKFALDRVREQDSDFSYLEEKTTVYKAALKSYAFKRMLLISNEDLNKGVKSIDDILVFAREELHKIVANDQEVEISSTRDFTQKFLEEYQKEIDASGLAYGLKPIDDVVGLIAPGELHLLAGASGEGKSQVLLNILHHNLVYRKKNCLMCSLEMGKMQYLYRMISLHSTIPKFGYNIPHEKIKKKELSPTEESQFYEVLQDLFENRDYGELFFAENVSTAQDLFDEAEDINRFCRLDGIFIDYLSLLRGKGSSEQAVIANNFKDIKQFALNFDKGRHIPVITVHQISEQAKQKAEEGEGVYELNFLADTSEARKSSDMVAWLIRTKQHKESHEIGMGISKVRDAEEPSNFSLFEDFAHSRVQAIDSSLE